MLLEDVKSPPWLGKTGWHLDGAAVPLPVTDRLQYGNPDKQKHGQTDSALDSGHSINLHHHQPHSHFASTATLVQIYSPVFPLQTRGVEPSQTNISRFHFYNRGNTDPKPNGSTMQLER